MKPILFNIINLLTDRYVERSLHVIWIIRSFIRQYPHKKTICKNIIHAFSFLKRRKSDKENHNE